MPTMLATIIDQSVRASVANSLVRTTNYVAEELAAELLRDPKFKATIRALVSAAFEKALADLQQDAPAE